MDVLHSLTLKDNIKVLDGATVQPIPHWALAFMWLGAWCRSYRGPGKRLIVFAVVPSRDLAAAFSCFGSLVEGSRSFEDKLSWTRFRALPPGALVFWKQPRDKKSFSGTIIGFERPYGGDEFIRIQVTKPVSIAKTGLIQNISERYFDEFQFSVEQPPSTNRANVYTKAENFIKRLVGKINPKWIWADGAEALLVTGLAKFDQTLSDLSLVTGEAQSAPLMELLCAARNHSPNQSKVRVSHPRGSISGTFPLVILDGPEAFYVHEHLDATANILVILDRSEYRPDINNVVLQLGSVTGCDAECVHIGVPDEFPPGVEISAYIVDSM